MRGEWSVSKWILGSTAGLNFGKTQGMIVAGNRRAQRDRRPNMRCSTPRFFFAAFLAAVFLPAPLPETFPVRRRDFVLRLWVLRGLCRGTARRPTLRKNNRSSG